MTEKLSPLKRYDYVGKYAKDEYVVGVVDGYLHTTMPEVEAREVEDRKYEEQFDAMGNSVWELGEDLGLDLSDRQRSPDCIHLYEDGEFAAVRRQFGLNIGILAVHSTSGHMFASEGKTPIETLANVNHELVHVVSRKSIRPDAACNVTRSHDGYSSHRHGSFDAVSEILTEMTNIDLIRNYWPHRDALSDVVGESYNRIGYSSLLILFDELLKDRFDSPHETFKKLQRGMFTGEMGTLRIVTEVVGGDMMRKIAMLDANDDAAALLLSQGFGLDDAARKINSIYKSEDLLSWL